MVRVGCCGWAAAQRRYFAALDALEVQQTFYQPPALSTLRRWRQAAPPQFEFTVKCFQVVTHERKSPTYRRLRRSLPEDAQVGHLRDTPWVRAAWQETALCAQALRARVILVQMPPSFTPTPAHLEQVEEFARWSRTPGVQIAFEPRGEGWAQVDLSVLCSRLGWWCVYDPLASAPPRAAGQEIAYFRLHGLTGYRYRYTHADLDRLRSIVAGFREAWVFFNNVSMWDDARRFRACLQKA